MPQKTGTGVGGEGLISESLCEPYAARVARTVTGGGSRLSHSVVAYPICSMIYGSTGVTHFDQLADILTGYEMTLFGARSGGIFAGILFIAVGSLFKITAVPFRAAVGRPPMGGRQIAANRPCSFFRQLPSPRGH